MKKSYLLIGFFILFAGAAKTQSVGIGTTSPNSSALLELKSNTKGLLLPTMTAAGRNAISNPAKGLMIYDTTYNTHYYYNCSAWRPIGSSRYNTDSSLNVGNQVNPVQSYNINTFTSTNDTSGFLYDNGGPGGNYTDNRNDQFQINNSGEFGIVIEIFQMDTESPNDSLTIDVNNQHYAYWGIATDTLVIENLTTNVSIRFLSNTVNNAPGFGLKWKKILPGSNPVSGYDSTQLSGWYFNDTKLYMRGGYNSYNNWHPDSSGSFSFAFGKNVKAKGYGSIAMGTINKSSGQYSTALGFSTTASGDNSTAIGSRTTASGSYSTALGSRTTASGYGSTAMGESTTASGASSTAMGQYSTASGAYSTAMGQYSTASGDNSTAIGSSTTASGASSTAMGLFTKASGSRSTAMGSFTKASGYSSTAMGESTTASGQSANAMGYNTKANGNSSTAMGVASIAKGYASTVLGMFNDSILTSDQNSVTSITPLFIVGNGENNTSRSNALVVRKDGKVFIDASGKNSGTSTEHLLLFGNNTSGEGIGSKRTTGGNQNGLDFYTSGINRMSIENNGNIGVNVLDPSSRLEIRGALGFSSTTKRWEMNYDSTDMYFYIDEIGSGRRFYIKNGGNVGINNNNPSEKLDVTGNGKFSGNLTVQNGKGLIRNTDGTQSKKLSTTALINSTFTAGQTKMLTITWPEAFSGTPEAFVGNVTSGVGGWAELTMSVSNVTTTGADLYIFNPKSSSVSPNFNIKIIAIGPQ